MTDGINVPGLRLASDIICRMRDGLGAYQTANDLDAHAMRALDALRIELSEMADAALSPTIAQVDVREALKLAITHIKHMATWIGSHPNGYHFEALGEDLPGIEGALSTPVAQGDEVRDARTEYGWLIERDSRDGLRYATPRSWAADHMKALRFARKIDAGAFAASRQDWSTDIRITEHAWD